MSSNGISSPTFEQTALEHYHSTVQKKVDHLIGQTEVDSRIREAVTLGISCPPHSRKNIWVKNAVVGETRDPNEFDSILRQYGLFDKKQRDATIDALDQAFGENITEKYKEHIRKHNYNQRRRQRRAKEKVEASFTAIITQKVGFLLEREKDNPIINDKLAIEIIRRTIAKPESHYIKRNLINEKNEISDEHFAHILETFALDWVRRRQTLAELEKLVAENEVDDSSTSSQSEDVDLTSSSNKKRKITQESNEIIEKKIELLLESKKRSDLDHNTTEYSLIDNLTIEILKRTIAARKSYGIKWSIEQEIGKRIQKEHFDKILWEFDLDSETREQTFAELDRRFPESEIDGPSTSSESEDLDLTTSSNKRRKIDRHEEDEEYANVRPPLSKNEEPEPIIISSNSENSLPDSPNSPEKASNQNNA